jgi:hypothetical protein
VVELLWQAKLVPLSGVVTLLGSNYHLAVAVPSGHFTVQAQSDTYSIIAQSSVYGGGLVVDECGTKTVTVSAGQAVTVEVECKPPAAQVPTLRSPSVSAGYWILTANGGVDPFGPGGLSQRSASDIRLTHPVVAMTGTPDGGGYWLVASDGGIFTYGNAFFFGSTAGKSLSAPIVSIAATPDGHGYWLLASDGSVFNFGDATPAGSAAGQLAGPAVAIASNAYGTGYWILDQEGHVVGENATAYGSATVPVGDRAVALASTLDGQGYVIALRSGRVQAFGDAANLGQAPPGLDTPIVGLAGTPDGRGYYLVGQDGAIFSFGDAKFFGSAGATGLDSAAVGLAVADRPAVGATLHLYAEGHYNNTGDVLNIHPSDQIVVIDSACLTCGQGTTPLLRPDPAVLSLTSGPGANLGGPNTIGSVPDAVEFIYHAVGVGSTSASIETCSDTYGVCAVDLSFGVNVVR